MQRDTTERQDWAIKARELVEEGALLLDRSGPPDWEYAIELDELDLSSCLQCLLGQLYGHYVEGVDALLGDTSFLGYDFGFDIPSGAPNWMYPVLQAAWVEEIYARRGV